jgi:murein DD-endopeptidase MepM/ murein hydrolase activator NlpD
MMLLNNQRARSLRGLMPAPGFQRELAKVVHGALPRAQVAAAGANVGAQAAQAGQAVTGAIGGLTMGGGPSAHHSRALGNWQSDDAYDLMGKAGQPIYAGIGGVVTKISGQPGGSPGFAGYGITVRTPQGDLFYKHLGTARVKVGQKIKPGMLIGTLDAKTAGGPHLHLGGTNRALLDRLAKAYTA